MCVGSMRHEPWNTWLIRLLQLIALAIEILDCDSNFDLSSASCATQVKLIDPIPVSVVACVFERWVRQAWTTSTPCVRIRKVKISTFWTRNLSLLTLASAAEITQVHRSTAV
jgi:hypothetical protein